MAEKDTSILIPGLEWQLHAFKAAVAANREWLDFVSHRLKQDADFADRLMGCRDADDTWRACSEFWNRAATDYQNEFASLMKIGTEAFSTGNGDLGKKLDTPTRSKYASAA